MPHLPTPITTTFEYIDADGIETRRTVDIYRTAKAGGYTRITGWCHGRQAERTFRSDRLQSVITKDGEVLSPGEFLTTIIPGKAGDVSMSSRAPSAEGDESNAFITKLQELCAGMIAVIAIYFWITTGWKAALGFLIAMLLLWLLARFLWTRPLGNAGDVDMTSTAPSAEPQTVAEAPTATQTPAPAKTSKRKRFGQVAFGLLVLVILTIAYDLWNTDGQDAAIDFLVGWFVLLAIARLTWMLVRFVWRRVRGTSGSVG